MATSITTSRLYNQCLAGSPFAKAEDLVRWMGAVQAQEYADAKWGLALRMQRGDEARIERAITEGTILRTHVMRPTWHFVPAADIRWMLALTAPRVAAVTAPYHRRLELDGTVFRRSQKAMVRALHGGVQLTRQELKTVLNRADIRTDGVQRLAQIVMQAELDAVICSGARRGKQFTYALLDERAPASRVLTRDEALAELTRRYFTSHGPAQPHDFAWWSGLTVADARAGLGMIEGDVSHETLDGKTYWFASSVRGTARARPAYLLPLYDEYLIAYRDRSAALDPARWTRLAPRDPFSAAIIVNGQVAGGWRRAPTKDRIVMTLTPFRPLGKNERTAVVDAAHDYAAFVGLAADISMR